MVLDTGLCEFVLRIKSRKVEKAQNRQYGDDELQISETRIKTNLTKVLRYYYAVKTTTQSAAAAAQRKRCPM